MATKRNIQDLVIIGNPVIVLHHLHNGSLSFDIKHQAIVKKIYHMLGSFHSKSYIHVPRHNNKKESLLSNEGVHLAKGNLKVVLSLTPVP